MRLLYRKQNGAKQTIQGYFNNPKTEEELNRQYRRLLRRFNCLSERNAYLLRDIQHEYFSTLLALRQERRTTAILS